jgi:hypothetical protein
MNWEILRSQLETNYRWSIAVFASEMIGKAILSPKTAESELQMREACLALTMGAEMNQ